MQASLDALVREEFATVVAPRPPRPKPSVSLSWDTPRGSLTAYRIYAGYSTDNWLTNWVVYPNFATNADGTVFTNVVTLTNLQPHPYAFAVASTNATMNFQSVNSGPAWFQMNSNGYVWENTFYWLAPKGRTSVVETVQKMGQPWLAVFTVTPTNDTVLAWKGTNQVQQYFRRTVK